MTIATFDAHRDADLQALRAELAQANDLDAIIAREASAMLDKRAQGKPSSHALLRLQIAVGEWRRRQRDAA